MLQRLIYFSHRQPGCSALAPLVAKAAHANLARGITGLLVADDAFFLQVLEGERAALSQLFLTISRDPRHSDVTVVSVEDINAISYPNWGMGQLADLAKIAALWWKAGAERVFDPRTMNAREIRDFLRLSTFELLNAERAR